MHLLFPVLIPSHEMNGYRCRRAGHTQQLLLVLAMVLQDLDASLRKLDSQLYVLRGNPKDVIPVAAALWGATRIVRVGNPQTLLS